MMSKELQQYSTMLKLYLEQLAPVLSGNTAREIIMAELVTVSDNEVTFCISAPYYDMKRWQETGAIIHTGTNVNGKTDYANEVNEAGGFGSHNESEHWVYRVCDMVARTIADAEVDWRMKK